MLDKFDELLTVSRDIGRYYDMRNRPAASAARTVEQVVEDYLRSRDRYESALTLVAHKAQQELEQVKRSGTTNGRGVLYGTSTEVELAHAQFKAAAEAVEMVWALHQDWTTR